MKKHFLFFLLIGMITILVDSRVGYAPSGPPGFGRQENRLAEETPKGNGILTGILVDSASAKPVEVATIVLISLRACAKMSPTSGAALGWPPKTLLVMAS